MSELLRKKRDEFERQTCAFKLATSNKSSWELMHDIIQQRGLSKSHFCSLTGLDEIVYRRAEKGEQTMQKPKKGFLLCKSMTTKTLASFTSAPQKRKFLARSSSFRTFTAWSEPSAKRNSTTTAANARNSTSRRAMATMKTVNTTWATTPNTDDDSTLLDTELTEAVRMEEVCADHTLLEQLFQRFKNSTRIPTASLSCGAKTTRFLTAASPGPGPQTAHLCRPDKTHPHCAA